MTTYFALCRLDRAGLQALLEDDAAIARLKERQGSATALRELWLTTGDFDLVLRLDAEQEADARAFIAAFAADANAEATTLTALDDSQARETLQDAHTKIADLLRR